MRGARLLLAVMAALAVGACARQQPTYYVIDPNTGQPVPVVTAAALRASRNMRSRLRPAAYQQPSPAQSDRGLFSSSPAYAQQAYGQPAIYSSRLTRSSALQRSQATRSRAISRR